MYHKPITDRGQQVQEAGQHQIESLRNSIRWDREHLAACIAQWRAESLPQMRSYRRAVCSRVIWHIRIAQSNLASWGVK